MKMHCTMQFGMRSLLGLVLVALLATPATAVTLYHHDLDPTHMLFGNLDQHDVPGCGSGDMNVACGPTAAVNSFAFLQNKFPNIYDNKLIPDTMVDGDMDGDIDDYDKMIAAAVALQAPEYMECVECNGGTFILPRPDLNPPVNGSFITGKRKWIEDHAPGTTIFKDRQNPNWDFLFGELWDMEDVELLVGFYDAQGVRRGGHYITLSKFWWEDTNMDNVVQPTENAMIGFVDPDDGTMKMRSLFQAGPGSILQTDYLVGGIVASTRVDWAVSESPVPEPATITLFSLALFGFVGLTRRRGR